jgi:hypothetical protein
MPGRGLAKHIFIVACCLAAPFADAAGLQLFDIPATDAGLSLTGIVWTPCAAAASEVALGGGVVLPGVRDCPISGNRLPLIVVSHGRRGTFIAHNDTATALADAGFVVAAINHPGDNARDSSRTDEFSVLVERPADMKRLTDFMLGAWKEADRSVRILARRLYRLGRDRRQSRFRRPCRALPTGWSSNAEMRGDSRGSCPNRGACSRPPH